MDATDIPQEHRARSGQGGQTHFPDSGSKRNLLVVTRGHAFQRDPFYDMFEDNPAIEWSAVEHPAAQLLFNPEAARHFDCYVLYDMPGIQFVRDGDRKPIFHPPPAFYQQGLLTMLERGTPLVVLHHAIAAWPAWPQWADIVGGRFHYQPVEQAGQVKPDSGYRLNVTHRISPVSDHPIVAGLESFELTDELYLFEVHTADIEPLLVSDFSFTDSEFFSARRALEGHMNDRQGWQHPPGSSLVGWVKHYANSPIVYLQCGDGPAAYRHPQFRQLLYQAIDWACSAQARSWVEQRIAAEHQQ
ncbi:ThuA domain-containing protein [Halopseudomonas bauzanensis]|uniref:ThuA domain-containing protein n=1 Tax=Halopseudomonas bauzanensis TaxID=653930 RepID=UPI002555EE05|nr:ThuA domain-containing protein [Halopseudomonas bauzanensis]